MPYTNTTDYYATFDISYLDIASIFDNLVWECNNTYDIVLIIV